MISLPGEQVAYTQSQVLARPAQATHAHLLGSNRNQTVSWPADDVFKFRRRRFRLVRTPKAQSTRSIALTTIGRLDTCLIGNCIC